MIKGLIAYNVMLFSIIGCMFVVTTNIWWIILLSIIGLVALVWICVFIIIKEDKNMGE